MRGRTLQLAAAFCAIAIAATSAQTKKPHRPRATAPAKKPAAARPEPPALPCGDYFSFQVLLDRQGFSPGEIDGHPGNNFSHALAALQSARHLATTGQADCDTWHALGGDAAGELAASYTVTDADLAGPFEKQIPQDLLEQAKLPALGYRSPLELVAEKFHASPGLITRLNPNVKLEAGATILVPATQPFDPSTKPGGDPAAADAKVAVTKDDSALRVVRPDDSVIFFAPVTTGSEHDPLPIGDWKVTGVQWKPQFHYNPKLFWDAEPHDTRATIKPGPNNPVGVVWIALNKEHYGLHGTPEPAHVGHTESHGCVRLTNWDAARLASLVRPGTPVMFR